MLFQTIGFLEVLAEMIGAIWIFLEPIIRPIGEFMVSWITDAIQFIKENLGSSLTFYIVVTTSIIVLGIFINIIWPGDRPGSIFSKGVGKADEYEEKIGVSEDEDIVDGIKRCKDCGNPVGDSEICPLCGARQI